MNIDKIHVSLSCLTSTLSPLSDNVSSFISSPEHEVLKVSYCGQSMSIVRRTTSVMRYIKKLIHNVREKDLEHVLRSL